MHINKAESYYYVTIVIGVNTCIKFGWIWMNERMQIPKDVDTQSIRMGSTHLLHLMIPATNG